MKAGARTVQETASRACRYRAQYPFVRAANARPTQRVSVSEDVDLLVLGERVALGVLRRDLLPVYQSWLNELEVRRGTGSWSVDTPEAQEAWYR